MQRRPCSHSSSSQFACKAVPRVASEYVKRQRLDRLLSNTGYASRSEVRRLLRTKVVLIGTDVRARDPSIKVSPELVTVDGEPLDHHAGILVLVNKPCGLVCSHDEQEGPNVYSLLPLQWASRRPQVTSVGRCDFAAHPHITHQLRLDKDTSGLILITDQSHLVHQLTSPHHKVTKGYEAVLENAVPESQQADMVASFASGTLMLHKENRACAPAELTWVDDRTARVVLTEGRYHQVRRMFAACSCHATALRRYSFGDLTIDTLAEGSYRELPLSYFDEV